MKVTVQIEVEIPDGATHFHGNILDSEDVSFYKCRQIGAVGDHWFSKQSHNPNWTLVAHHMPHWINPLPAAGEVLKL